MTSASEGDRTGKRVIMEKRRDRKLSLRDPTASAAWLLIILGAALLIASLARAGALWFPPNLSSQAWTFTAVGLVLAELPLLGLGSVLLCVGLLRSGDPNPGWIRLASLAFALLVLVLLGLAAVYVPALAAVARRAAEESLDVMRREMVSTLATLATFTLGFAGTSVILWLAVEKNG